MGKKHFNFVYIVLVLNGRKYQVSDEYWTRSKTSFTSIFHRKVMFDGMFEQLPVSVALNI